MSVDIGEKLHSPSAALMKLVDCSHLNDFDDVCNYLALHAMEVCADGIQVIVESLAHTGIFCVIF